MASKGKQFDIQLFPGKVSLWAELTEDSSKKIELISVALRYAVNDIPTGRLELAMGYNAETLEPSAAHTVLAGVKATTGIKVFCKLEPDESAKKEIPEGTFMIFDGYTAGPVGMTKSIDGQLGLTLQIVGWLEDLNYSSVASSSFYPDAPENFFKHVGYNVINESGTTMVAVEDLRRLSENFDKDVWGVLKKIFEKLAAGNTVEDSIRGGDATPNQSVIDALGRFDQNITTAKLSLDPVFSAAPALPDAMTSTMSGTLFSTISGSTAWSKLLDASGLFFFRIIPIPDGAAAVPHFSVLSGEPFATIKASEQFSISLQPSLPRQIAALWLVRREALGLVDATQAGEYGFMVGAADTSSNGQPARGMVVTKMLPEWMSQSMVSANLTKNPSASIPNSQKRVKGAPPVPPVIFRMEKGGPGFILAKMLLLLEQYKMRIGSVTGKVRFDIGPGSFVKIEGTGLPTIGFSPNMLANVTQVNLSFSAMQPSASTTFVLSHIRTEDELDIGLPKNPMYKDKWNGTALIKAPSDV